MCLSISCIPIMPMEKVKIQNKVWMTEDVHMYNCVFNSRNIGCLRPLYYYLLTSVLCMVAISCFHLFSTCELLFYTFLAVQSSSHVVATYLRSCLTLSDETSFKRDVFSDPFCTRSISTECRSLSRMLDALAWIVKLDIGWTFSLAMQHSPP